MLKNLLVFIVVFINMTKVCAACKIKKPLDSFHKCLSAIDGRNNKCRICVNNYNKIRNEQKEKKRDTSLRKLAIISPTKDDFLNMYLFLKSSGYDPTKDIHKQFCEKYKLPYKVRDDKSKNIFSWKDCIKTDELEKL
jgi:hypothetical protein